jgi:hypothetical protein
LVVTLPVEWTTVIDSFLVVLLFQLDSFLQFYSEDHNILVVLDLYLKGFSICSRVSQSEDYWTFWQDMILEEFPSTVAQAPLGRDRDENMYHFVHKAIGLFSDEAPDNDAVIGEFGIAGLDLILVFIRSVSSNFLLVLIPMIISGKSTVSFDKRRALVMAIC